jgi:hypothetical protein
MKYRPVSYPGLVAGADWNGFSVRHYLVLLCQFAKADFFIEKQ